MTRHAHCWVAVALAIHLLGCSGEDDPGVPIDAGDPPDDGAPPPMDGGITPVSLDGPQSCEAMTCASGQICVWSYSGTDTGVPDAPRCEAPPADCDEFFGCARAGGECCEALHECAHRVCGGSSASCMTSTLIEYSGRTIRCGGA